MFKTLDSYDFKGKRVLVRIDINSEVKNRKITESDRFKAPVKTIKELISKKAKVVLMAHQGRLGSPDFTNLEQHYKIMKKLIPKLKFVNDVMGFKAVLAIREVKEGECLMLDNVRSVKEESEPIENNRLLKRLAPLFDYYVNDAFSVSHREQISVTGFPTVIPGCIGRALETELKNLDKLNIQNCVFVLGGAKTEDVELLFKNKIVLTTGAPSLVCLLAKGVNLGLENDKSNQINDAIKNNIDHLTVPVDLAINMNGKRKEMKLNEFPSEYRIYDIGAETIKQYSRIIKNAKSVFMKGTPGFAEIKGFEKGTKELLKAVASSKAFSVIAGGHTTIAMKRFKINRKKIGYISLSGGALVYYLAGKPLPGLEVLNK